MNNSTINVPSLSLGGLNFNNFASNSAKINISNVDVDINKEIMGRLTANNYGAIVNSSVNVNNLNGDNSQILYNYDVVNYNDNKSSMTINHNYDNTISNVCKYEN